MRRWQLDNKKPIALPLAADARLCETDYVDDQSWQLLLGKGDDSALTFQTRYGGRAGLASLVPMWMYEREIIFEAQAYHTPPVIKRFAPGFMQVNAGILPDLAVSAEYWIADSHSVSVRFQLKNSGASEIRIRLDLYGHVISLNQELKVSILTLADESNALYFGKLSNIDPVVVLEDGRAAIDPDGRVPPKIGRDLVVPAGETVDVRWAHAALPEMVNSVRRGRYWLSQSYVEAEKQIAQAAEAVPQVETGTVEMDALIAFTYQQALQSFLRSTEHLPQPSFVSSRSWINGFSHAGDGSDYPREWSGQEPTIAYLLAYALASVEPRFAEGIVRNYIANQKEDGWIDWSPGLGGQQRGWLMMPILARMAFGVYEFTQNIDFLREVFPALLKFYERWFAEDVDADQDGLPEWQTLPQTGYAGWQLFVHGIDITMTETPDMLAYLLSEGVILREVAKIVGADDAVAGLTERIDAQKMRLNDLWQEDGFVYVDRDTHATPDGMSILEKVKADEEHFPALPLVDASRVIIEIFGGAAQKPRMSFEVQGITPRGEEITETIDGDRVVWSYGRGTVMSKTVFAQVDRVKSTGLSRVFRLSARSTDLNNTDMNTLLPIISGAIDEQQAEIIAQKLQDTSLLLKPNGLSLYPTPVEPGMDESGVWVFWNTLICEGLFEYGYGAQAVDLLKRLMKVQTASLRATGGFTMYYDEDDMRGVGGRFHLGGMVPLHVLMMAFGFYIRVNGSVQVDADFHWGSPVTVRQYGTTVYRDTGLTRVTFSDGQEVKIPVGTAQEVFPKVAVKHDSPALDLPEKPPLVTDAPPVQPVSIKVVIDDDHETGE